MPPWPTSRRRRTRWRTRPSATPATTATTAASGGAGVLQGASQAVPEDTGGDSQPSAAPPAKEQRAERNGALSETERRRPTLASSRKPAGATPGRRRRCAWSTRTRRSGSGSATSPGKRRPNGRRRPRPAMRPWKKCWRRSWCWPPSCAGLSRRRWSRPVADRVALCWFQLYHVERRFAVGPAWRGRATRLLGDAAGVPEVDRPGAPAVPVCAQDAGHRAPAAGAGGAGEHRGQAGECRLGERAPARYRPPDPGGRGAA